MYSLLCFKWRLNIACQHTHTHTLVTVNRIKTETGTSIIIPPDEEKSDVIRIEGDPKGVAAAKTMLLEMAAKMVSLLPSLCCYMCAFREVPMLVHEMV